jgi:hypothetical protein
MKTTMKTLTILFLIMVLFSACESRKASTEMEFLPVDTSLVNDVDSVNMDWVEELQISDSVADVPDDITNMSDDEAMDELDRIMTGESLGDSHHY